MNEEYPVEINLDEVDKAILDEARENLAHRQNIFRELYHNIFDHPGIWGFSTLAFHFMVEGLMFNQYRHITEQFINLQEPSTLERIIGHGIQWGIPLILGLLVSLYQRSHERTYHNYRNELDQEYMAEVQRIVQHQENSVSEH